MSSGKRSIAPNPEAFWRVLLRSNVVLNVSAQSARTTVAVAFASEDGTFIEDSKVPTAEALTQQCAPQVSPTLMRALVGIESGWRPFAIGMDAGQGSVKQPASLAEAVHAAKTLASAGRRFSVGLAQIHMSNVAMYGMTWEQAFDACQNLAVGQKILWRFYERASAAGYSGVSAVWAALRGYNSGGVDRAISNDYANRVFTYMNGATASLRFGEGVAMPAGRQEPLPLATPSRTAASTEQEKTHPNESQDIFERAKDRGF